MTVTRRSIRAAWLVTVVFSLLGIALGLGLWGSVVHPPAYELRAILVARPSPELILVRHDAVPGLGMGSMDLMAISVDANMVDRAQLRPGDHVRLGVKQRNETTVLLTIEKVR